MSNIVERGRKLTKLLLCVAAAGILSACGGGSGGGSSLYTGGSSGSSGSGGTTTTTTTPSAADLVLVLSKSTLSNSGTDSLTVTATAIDSNRAAVGKVPVTFSVNGNAVITPGGTTTDATTGELTATVTEGSDSSLRTVTVTATSGSITRTVVFNVVQAAASTTPQAADLSLVLSASNIDDSGSKTVSFTATAVDANRNALSGIPVTIGVGDNSAFASVNGSQTNSSGQVTGTISIGQDHSNRTVGVTATSGTLVRTSAFVVSGATLQATALPALVVAGGTGAVKYTLTDVNGNPMSGLSIVVTASGLATVTGTTDGNGAYTYNYTAPNAPGTNLAISAAAGGTTTPVTVTIPSGTSSIPAVTTTVVSSSVAAAPNVVGVNNGSTNNQSSLTARFLGAGNAPIQNIRVRFDLDGDPNSVGGTIGAGTNLVYTDATGVATSTYAPGAIPSPTNGVTIRACWDYADFTAGTCPNQVTQTLSVVSTPVSIGIGYDNTISQGSTGLTYVKKFVLTVTDSAGNPKSDVQITPSILLNGYFKGAYVWDAVNTVWDQYYILSGTLTLYTSYTADPTLMCPNEDIDHSGSIKNVVDVNGNTVSDDLNGIPGLDPRQGLVTVSMVGSTKTDSTGVAVMQIEYPKNYATWISFTITASAAGVLSPPATYTGVLPALSTDLTTQTPPPAFVNSPYGANRNKPTDRQITGPDGVTRSYCTNSN